MKTLFLALSLLSSVNLFCEDAWISLEVTYEHILSSYSMADLKKEKQKLEKELTQCNDSTEKQNLQEKLNSVEKTIQSVVKREEKEREDYKRKVAMYSLEKLESERDMHERSLNVDPNEKIQKLLNILKAEIAKRKQAKRK